MGLALLYGALDQGERLNWLNSGVTVALSTAGLFLLGAAWVQRMLQPNPVANLSFLNTRNIIILAATIYVFRFMMLAPVVLIPGFLGNIHGSRPAETGHALAWVALPACGGLAGGSDSHLHTLAAGAGRWAHHYRGGLLDVRAYRCIVVREQFLRSGACVSGWAGMRISAWWAV